MFCTIRDILIISLVVLPGTASFGESEHRSHRAHQHGIAYLGVIEEGGELSFVLNAPASDLVGFEHPAVTKQEVDALSTLEATLAQSNEIFDLPGKAQCSQVQHAVKHNLHKKIDEHTKHHAEHGPSHHEHEDAHKHHESSHSEIVANYRFKCADIEALGALKVGLFTKFPALEKIEAAVVTSSSQGRQVLSPKSSILRLNE